MKNRLLNILIASSALTGILTAAFPKVAFGAPTITSVCRSGANFLITLKNNNQTYEIVGRQDGGNKLHRGGVKNDLINDYNFSHRDANVAFQVLRPYDILITRTPSCTKIPVSVELFLSVDVSGSINSTEYALQKNGYIAAFQDTEVINAIKALPDGLAVAIETWHTSIKKTSPWYLIKDEQDAAEFVTAIQNTLNASSGGGGTDVTNAIESATEQILNNEYTGEKLVIDVSGDGVSKNTSVGNPNSSQYNNYKTQVREYLDNNGLSNMPNPIIKDSYNYYRYRNEFSDNNYRCSIGQDLNSNQVTWQIPIEHLYCPPLKEAVDNAEANNITINGLPINGDSTSTSGIQWREGEISEYYQNHVITSDGFVQVANGFTNFADAVKAKITREIANEAPNIVNDTANTEEDVEVTIDVLDNDTDPDNDTLTIESATTASKGTTSIVTVNGKQQVKYTPNTGTTGEDTFTYTATDGNGNRGTATVTMSISPKNNAPNVVDDTATTDEGVEITIDVLDNDTDPDQDTLTIDSVTNASKGTVEIVTVDGKQQVKYTPNADSTGQDSFTYTASDGEGGTGTATVGVTIDEVDDEPTDPDPDPDGDPGPEEEPTYAD